MGRGRAGRAGLSRGPLEPPTAAEARGGSPPACPNVDPVVGFARSGRRRTPDPGCDRWCRPECRPSRSIRSTRAPGPGGAPRYRSTSDTSRPAAPDLASHVDPLDMGWRIGPANPVERTRRATRAMARIQRSGRHSPAEQVVRLMTVRHTSLREASQRLECHRWRWFGKLSRALASGQAVRRLTLDQEILGSNPSSPASHSRTKQPRRLASGLFDSRAYHYLASGSLATQPRASPNRSAAQATGRPN